MAAEELTAADNAPGAGAHVVVVGAGIAGLAAAHALLEQVPGARVTVVEGAVRIGGKLRAGEVAGRPVDLGAESVLNRRPEAVDLARAVGLGEDLVHPATTSAGVWTRGSVRPLPRTVMGVPADLGDLAPTGIVSRRALRRARLDRLLPRVDVEKDVAIGELVGRRLGGEIRDRLVEPLLGGVYAGRSDELSLQATVPQLLPALSDRGRLLDAAGAVMSASSSSAASTGTAPVFAGVRGGVARLAEAIGGAVRARGGAVRCRTTVRELSLVSKGFSLVLGPTIAPETLTADAVILAVPAAPAARLLRAAAPRAAIELGDIPYSSMAVVTLAFPTGESGAELAGSGFLVPPVDGKAIKAATYSSRKWEWTGSDPFIVRCSIGRYGEARLLQRDDSELISLAVTDLRDAVGLQGRPIDALVTRWGGALPQYTVGHLDRVRRLMQAVAEVPGLAVCGAAYDGVGIAACVASGQRAATRVAEHLAARETM